MTLSRTLSGAASAAVVAIVVGGAWAASAPPDRRPPTKPTVDGQLRPTVLRPVFTFGATDARTPRGKVRFRCGLDGAALRPCARIHRPASALSLGRHMLRVRALDLAGNLSRTTSFSFTVVGQWDAARDFERAPRPANPGRDRYGNTTWFYLYSSPSGAQDPASYTILPTFWVVAANWETWVVSPNWNSATNGFLNGVIAMQPGPAHNRQSPVLGWRSPVAQTVAIVATIGLEPQAGCPDPANGITWSLAQNARPLRSGTLAPGGNEDIELTATVSVGDSVYVVMGDNGDPRCDTTTVQLAIETA